ncbi:unnamed protein product, partial [Allacma fusca]
MSPVYSIHTAPVTSSLYNHNLRRSSHTLTHSQPSAADRHYELSAAQCFASDSSLSISEHFGWLLNNPPSENRRNIQSTEQANLVLSDSIRTDERSYLPTLPNNHIRKILGPPTDQPDGSTRIPKVGPPSKQAFWKHIGTANGTFTKPAHWKHTDTASGTFNEPSHWKHTDTTSGTVTQPTHWIHID